MTALAMWGLASPFMMSPSGTLKDERGRNGFTLVCWLLIPLLAVWLISLRQPLFTDRYFIWSAPAFYLLLALGLVSLQHFGSWTRWVAVLLAGVILAGNGVNLWQQATLSIKSDFRAAAAYVRQHRSPEDLVLFHISYVRETFEYYYGDSSPSANGIPTDQETTEAAVDVAMREQIGNHQTVWVVLSEPEMWDRRGMTAAWLEEHARAEMRADFARVSVIQYRFPATLP